MTLNPLNPERHITLLSHSDGRRLAAGGLIGRSGYVGLSLAVLLYVQQQSDSFATAGLQSATMTGGAAVGRLVHAHLVERHSARIVLAVSSLVSPILLCAYLITVGLHADTWLQLVLVATVGFAAPALPPLARVLWGRMSTTSERSVYHGFEQTLTETSFVIGPLVAGFLAGGIGPLVACCVCGILSSFGGLIVSSTDAAAARTPERSDEAVSVLTGLLPFIVVIWLGGVAGGLTEVAIPAFAVERGQTGMSGVLMAVWGVGSVAGGILVGTRIRETQLKLWLVVSLFCLSISVLPAAFASTPLVLALVLALNGLAIVPAWGTFWSVVEESRGASRLGHVFAALYMASSVGVATGTAFGGWMIGAVSPAAPFILSSISYLILTMVAVFVIHQRSAITNG